jgi:DNA-binding CsgD family transcriptional regulator
MFGIPKNAEPHQDLPEAVGEIEAALPGFLLRFDLEQIKKYYKNKSASLARASSGNFTFSLIICRNLTGKTLSHQQRKIALLASEGLTNKEIAAQLGIKTGSVSSHMAHIYDKLNVEGRADLALKSILLLKERPRRSKHGCPGRVPLPRPLATSGPQPRAHTLLL